MRDFLLQNKELLEVIFPLVGIVSAALLGIMARRLTLNSNKTAESQLQVAAQGLALNQAQARPRFRTLWKKCEIPTPEFGDKAATGHGTNFDCVEVWNDGGPLEWFSVMQYSFLEISARDGIYQRRHMPIYYLFNRAFTGQGEGLIVTLGAFQSPPTFPSVKNVSAELSRLQTELLERGLAAEPRVFLEISYRTILREKGSILFEATGTFYDRWFSGPAFARLIPSEVQGSIARGLASL